MPDAAVPPLSDSYRPQTGGGLLVYSGELKNGLRDGQGTEYMAEGYKYTGFFKANQKKGTGKLEQTSSGYRYEGEFADDARNGKGLVYANGALVFEGEFKGGLRNGFGIRYENGVKEYEGGYRNDLRHGHGISYLSGRKQYEGQFKDDKWDGIGTLYNSTGGIEYAGAFRNGAIYRE